MKPRNNHTILYMDDDVDDLQMLQEAIHSIDGSYQLVEALDGSQGLRQLQQMKNTKELPCLIVLDVNMPRVGGKEAFLRIREDETLKDIPVVILSTSSSEADRRYFEGKNVEYITKPIDFQHLVSVAARLLHYCHN